MKLFGQELSNRELALIGATAVVVVAAGGFWLSRNGGESAASPSAVKNQLTASVRQLDTTLSDIARLRRDMDLGKFRLPGVEESPKVHLHIRTMALECGLAFTDLTNTLPKKGRGFETVDFRFKATAELKSLVKFVDLIQSGEYLIGLEKWDMKAGDDPRKVTMDVSLRAYFRPSGRERS